MSLTSQFPARFYLVSHKTSIEDFSLENINS